MGPVEGFLEHGHETSASNKGGAFLTSWATISRMGLLCGVT